MVVLGLFIMFAASHGMGMFMVVTHGFVGIYLLTNQVPAGVLSAARRYDR